MNKYERGIYNALKEHAEWNGASHTTDEAIDKLTRAKVLSIWLEWQGIIGYTNSILNIMGARK